MRRPAAIRVAWLTAAAILCLLTAGCQMDPGAGKIRNTMFIGVDTSGSFKDSGYYDNAIKFLARYIHAHLNGYGGATKPHALFVGSVGGRTHDEPKTFHPIHDFQGKSINKIERQLLEWFAAEDTLTDFNAFFEEVARITKQRNLVLSPITILLVSDGKPDFASSVRKGKTTRELYSKINLAPLEYLSRNITLRLTYPSPTVAKFWRKSVPRERVRLWTVDGEVMKRWPDYIQPNVGSANQVRFLSWMKDNVDFKVRAKRI